MTTSAVRQHLLPLPHCIAEIAIVALMRLLAAFGPATRIMIGACLLVLGRVATALGAAMHR